MASLLASILALGFPSLVRMLDMHASLTVARLVELVEEKTLVLLDEPEEHLHPPLVSALIRALSNLLIYRNGVKGPQGALIGPFLFCYIPEHLVKSGIYNFISKDYPSQFSQIFPKGFNIRTLCGQQFPG